ncbi:MAG: 30S ribosomal protein S4 [Candidatus Cloacimonetes bacterium]|nr:30S ribosomal protein S4 [Candidatus Cloacimonadota bacterium]
MARYTGPKAKICRKFGENIYGTPKYDRILQKKNYAPGQHGNTRGFRKKMSDYGIHLKEKQKLRHIYCLLEKQFFNYYEKAEKMAGVTGDNLLQILERRLDNTVYRMGFAVTRMQARQFVNHGHIFVNGKCVDIASYLLKPGDVVEIKEKSRSIKAIVDAMDMTSLTSPYSWLKVEKDKFKGEFATIPVADEIQINVDVRLIVEFYSK